MKSHTASMRLQLSLLDTKAPVWVRFNGASGGHCGAIHVHESGWKVIHCGHPTANWPYYTESPDGKESRIGLNGRGFRYLVEAKKAVEAIVSGVDMDEVSTRFHKEE